MALPTTTQLQELLDRLANSWSAGDGREFGASFTDNARFVAFEYSSGFRAYSLLRFFSATFRVQKSKLKNASAV